MLREKKVLELPVAKLVVGDILKFKCDDTLPVDGILVQVKRERGREGVWVCVKGEDRWVMANISRKAGQARLLARYRIDHTVRSNKKCCPFSQHTHTHTHT